MTANPAMPPTTPPTTWGVLGATGPLEPLLGSEEDPEVSIETGAVPIGVKVAAAPATVLPGVDSGREPDVRVEKVVLSDEAIKLVLAARSERVAVSDVVLTYETFIVDAAVGGVAVLEELEDSEGLLEGKEDSGEEEADGPGFEVGVKETSVGTGDGGGDDSTD